MSEMMEAHSCKVQNVLQWFTLHMQLLYEYLHTSGPVWNGYACCKPTASYLYPIQTKA